MWFVGVDVGGTFTDLFAFETESGRHVVHKTPSTPHNPALAIVTGVEEIARIGGFSLGDVTRLSHGTTVATNALLQRKGGRVALVTTKGFRDLLEIGRQIRPKMYSLQEDQAPPVVAREHRLELDERVLADGSIHRAPDEAELARVAEAVAATGADACAICLLFSFLEPRHEEMMEAALKTRAPTMQISRSSAVQPEFREFERASTAVLNAYLQPIMDRYLGTLADRTRELVPAAQLGICQSSGGLMSVDRARRFPVRTALSGPAAGAVGAIHVAKLSGIAGVVTLDMGGTSADICLIRDGEVGTSFDREVGGFPVRMPVVDIHTIGAGGGSIAWFDRDGLMKVGPISAGAAPGPACYGKGGTQPTVSDANLVLGRLGGRGLLGGRMALDLEAAKAAIRPVAEKLGCSIERAAHGILAIVTSNMVRAIRTVSVERGHDPRRLALMPFGGAGALHASDVARALGIRQVLVPLLPGILCAQGLIVSDVKEDFVRTQRLPLEAGSMAALEAGIAAITKTAEAWFDEEAIPLAARRLQLSFDLRYVGQNWELAVPAPAKIEAAALAQAFFVAHDRAYGFHNPQDPIELVNIRLTARGALEKPGAPPAKPAATAPAQARGRRPVWFAADAALDTPVYDRDDLAPGHAIDGPAIIDQMDATTVLFPGDRARVDAALNIIVEIGA